MIPQCNRAARLAAAALLVLAVLGLVLGSASGGDGWHAWWREGRDAAAHLIVWQIRLPRSVGAWLGGALLGLSGAVAQGLFRNPLADPHLLGSASGASLGVALFLAGFGALQASPAWAWLAQLGMVGAAFAGALLAVLLTLFLARGVHASTRLLLAGVVVGVVLGALASLLAQINPQVLQAMQGFMLGSTAFVGWAACLSMVLALWPCVLLALLLAPVLDALTLGEATARSLGVPLAAARVVLVLVLSLATGVAVAHLGLIAFVGLAAPHMVRAWVRGTHAVVLALSALMGGVLLLWADLIARVLLAPQELPVGVLTAVLGGLYLLWRLQPDRGDQP